MTNPIISTFFNINRPSIALIILAWIAFNFDNLFFSYPVKNNEILKILFSILFLELIFFFISNKKIGLFIILNTILFLFGYLITLNIQNQFNNLFEKIYRGRIIFFSMYLIFNIVFLFCKKVPKYNYVNIFLGIFIFINICKHLILNLDATKNNYTFLDRKVTFLADNKDSPILLLILDEYHSADDLYRVTCDSTLYNFSSTLKKNGWKINNYFNSEEIQTVRSLSSMFNYNLSSDSNFMKLGGNIPYNFFSENSLNSDLLKKGIRVINWGIFKFGYSNPIYLNGTPEYSFGIFSKFFRNTALDLIWKNTNNLNLAGFNFNYYPGTKHNIELLRKLKIPLNNLKATYFIYSHLYMPHYPFYYPKLFKYRKKNLHNYISFWKFTNLLIESKLLDITRSNKIKVIVTGDHGFRGDSRLNRKKTFLAIYGFDSININQIKNVQDLGSLINSNF